MEIHEVLHTIQRTLKAPKAQYNSFGKYNYRSCEDIVEAVKKVLPTNVSLVLSDEMVNVGNFNYIKATAELTDGTGTVKATGWARESVSKKGMDDSQITGSTSSYARKYALNGLFAIDDTRDADSNEQKVAALRKLIEQTNTDESKLLEHYKVNKLEDITGNTYDNALRQLERKLNENGKNG